MRFHDQQVLSNHDEELYGDCYRCCIASVLDVGVKEVPHLLQDLMDSDEYSPEYLTEQWDLFLASMGVKRMTYFFSDMGSPAKSMAVLRDVKLDVPVIVSGMSPRGGGHAVVYVNEEMVHDPHPSRKGLKSGFKHKNSGYYRIESIVNLE